MKMDDLGGKTPIFGVTSISRLFSSRHPGLTSGSVFKESPNMPKKKHQISGSVALDFVGIIRISFWNSNAWCELGDPKELCKIQSVLDILLDGFKYFLFSSLFGEDSHFD